MAWNLKKTKGWIKSKFIYEWNPVKRRKKLGFYRSMIANGNLCFDVGSHMGDRVDTWMALGATVVGIEPQPAFSEYLQKKYRGNRNYHHEPVAIGSEVGSAIMKISSEYPTISTLSGEQWTEKMNNATTKNLEYDKEVSVSLTTIDELIKKHGTPNFIKIDVEGFELEVLKGLSNKVDAISFEFLNTNKRAIEDCIKRLKELGFSQFNWSYEESFDFHFEFWQKDETVLESINSFEKDIFTGDVYAK